MHGRSPNFEERRGPRLRVWIGFDKATGRGVFVLLNSSAIKGTPVGQQLLDLIPEDEGFVLGESNRRATPASKRKDIILTPGRLEAGVARRSTAAFKLVVRPITVRVYFNGHTARLMFQIRTITRPLPLRGMFAKTSPDRIQVNVVELLQYKLRTPKVDRRKVFQPDSVRVTSLLRPLLSLSLFKDAW